jgi:hypothetical protein
VTLWLLRPEIARVIERVTEFDAFGVKAKLRAELDQSAKEVKQTSNRLGEPTEQQVERALDVKEIVGANPEIVRSQIDQLAEEYQNIRASMSPGDPRTRRMEIVTAKMRTIGLAAYPFRYELAASASPGKRLQAVACLQVRPDYDMLNWLAEWVGSERPFIAYHALVALNVAATAPNARDHLHALKDALRHAQTYSDTFGEDTDRKMALREFEQRVQRLSDDQQR